MDDTETLRRMAQSAVRGGAMGLRLNSPKHVRAIRADSDLPIIAIQKRLLGGKLRITPDFASAALLAAAGADIIALDCTDRIHAHGEPWNEIVRRIHAELGLLVMADIATLREGVAAAAAGVDMIGTTLNGYTEETSGNHVFSTQLVADLVRETGLPIVAEGHINTPAQAREALDSGAWCVVVGSAITRPGTITESFVRAMQAGSALTSTRRYVIGIDVGGTSIKGAIVSDQGETLSHVRVPTVASGGRDAIAKSLLQAVEQTIDAAEGRGITPLGIGIASAGAIDAKNGTVFAATENLPGWAGFNLREYITSRISLPVFVENDAHAAALAELHYGAGRGISNFVAITLGTGVGGGIVIDGKLQRGQFGFAGTVGHQTIRFDGRQCNCGRLGCLEAYVSTAALVQEYEARSPGTIVGEDAPTVAMQIGSHAAAGETAALQAYAALAGYLAEGIANLCNILDPQAIIISGGLIEDQSDFLGNVQCKVESLLHFGKQRPPVMLRASAGNYAGVQGAAATVFLALAD
jgi:N-acetylmannosamine-6-phosphate 2-epimerase / N-acetylmannosamine kinase